MLFSQFPPAQGLYDPNNEADSCGVAMIADIEGRRTHGIVADGLLALENLDHRGAAGAEPNSGDGAGILIQLPVELLREVAGFTLPEPLPDGSNTFAAGIGFLPMSQPQRAVAAGRIEAIAAEEGLDVLGWREVPVDVNGADIGKTALRVHALHEPAVRRRQGRRGRTARRHRARPSRLRPAQAGRAGHARDRGRRHRRVFPVVVLAHHGLQGHAHHRAAAAVLSGPARRAVSVRDRDRAQSVLHQHLPVLAALAPVPVRRAQRRDQHRAREPQPHARPRGDAGQRSHPRRPAPALPDLHPGGVGLGVLRRGPRTAPPRRPVAAARGDDDDPRGVGERLRDGAAPARVLQVPLRADGAVGRTGLRDLLRRHDRRRGARPQRAAARAVGGAPSTAG